jgi:hypothetical protein
LNPRTREPLHVPFIDSLRVRQFTLEPLKAFLNNLLLLHKEDQFSDILTFTLGAFVTLERLQNGIP